MLEQIIQVVIVTYSDLIHRKRIKDLDGGGGVYLVKKQKWLPTPADVLIP